MAVRIAGVVLQPNKRIEYALPKIYGVGLSVSRKVLLELDIDMAKKTRDLTEGEAHKLREVIEKNYKVEGDLRRDVLGNMKHEKDISTYRGSRYAKRLPVRGQRTKTNSRTIRGNVRKTMMSGKRQLTKT